MVNKWKDLADRVAWTAVQTFAGVAVVTGFSDWTLTLEAAGAAAAAAALKVVIAQQTSPSGDGSAIPGGVTK